jgi:hypothetical protein
MVKSRESALIFINFHWNDFFPQSQHKLQKSTASQKSKVGAKSHAEQPDHL